MLWTRRSLVVLVLSNICFIVAVVLLLTRSGDSPQHQLPYLGPPFIPTPTPVVYIESRFPWQAPMRRPAPLYGPLPFATPPGGNLKTPTEPLGPPPNATALQVRPNYLTPLNHMLFILKYMGGDTTVCEPGCLIPAGFLTQFEMVWSQCSQMHPRESGRQASASYPNPKSPLDEYGNDPIIGPLINAAAAVCDGADAAYRRLGTPAETQPWRDAVNAMAAQLDPVMREENSRRFTYPAPP